MTGLIVFFCLALGVSFFCSLMEAVILSVSHSFIESLVNKGWRSGQVLRELKERIDRPLAAILTLNTVANTVGAAGVGAQALKVYYARYGAMYGDTYAGYFVGVASGVLTLAILVLSEIIPKTLGAAYWKRLGPAAGYAIRGMIVVLYPVVAASEGLARWLARGEAQQKMSREEMLASAQIGADEGSLRRQETRIIRNLLRLQGIRAREVLTPRKVVRAFPERLTVGEVVRNHSPLEFSRLPVYGKDLDDVRGFVLRYELLQAYSKGRVTESLGRLAKPIHAVPETKSVANILEEFIRRREQIFLAVDEYGGTAGIITLEDAIETLLGVEIVDESDSVADMRAWAKQQAERRQREQLTEKRGARG